MPLSSKHTKDPSRKTWIFSFVPQAQHHLTEGQYHFEHSENIIPYEAAQMNDVALRANGTEHLSHIGATILHPNTKVLVNQGLFVFLGVEYNPIAPFLRAFVLEPAT